MYVDLLYCFVSLHVSYIFFLKKNLILSSSFLSINIAYEYILCIFLSTKMGVIWRETLGPLLQMSPITFAPHSTKQFLTKLGCFNSSTYTQVKRELSDNSLLLKLFPNVNMQDTELLATLMKELNITLGYECFNSQNISDHESNTTVSTGTTTSTEPLTSNEVLEALKMGDWPIGTKVATLVGDGEITATSTNKNNELLYEVELIQGNFDNSRVIKLEMVPSAILYSLSTNHKVKGEGDSEEAEGKGSPHIDGGDGDQNKMSDDDGDDDEEDQMKKMQERNIGVMGSQSLYLFLRYHQAFCNRLQIAKQVCRCCCWSCCWSLFLLHFFV
jgi:hypothetical protein